MTCHWARELAQFGHEVYGYTFAPDRDFEPELNGARWRQAPSRSSWRRIVTLPLWVTRQCELDDLDALICISTYPNLVGLASRLLSKGPGKWRGTLMITEHNVPSLYRRLLGKRGTAKDWICRLLYRYANGAVAVSHAVATDLIGRYGVDPDHCFVVPNPVFTDSQAAFQRLEGPDRSKTLHVGFAGRITTQKRPLLFVHTLRVLIDQGYDVQGHVCGDGDLLDQMRERAYLDGVPIKFYGWSADWLDDLAHVIDCLLLPSYVEGLAMVLIEAASRKIPCVAPSAALGVADGIVPGITGTLALSSTAEDLASALLVALSLNTAGLPGWINRWTARSSTMALLRTLELSEPPASRSDPAADPQVVEPTHAR